MSLFKASFKLNPKYSIGENIVAEFILENLTAVPRTILKRSTPLGILGGQYVSVSIGGAEVEYDGIFAKLGEPQIDEFAIIEPGGKLSAMLDITAVYEIDKIGKYTLSTDFAIAYFDISPAEAVNEVSETLEEISASITFEVVVGDDILASPIKTAGAKARLAEESARESSSTDGGIMISESKDPAIINCTNPATGSACKKAHHLVYEYLVASIEDFKFFPNGHYNLWFGAEDTTRKATAQKVFQDIKSALENDVITYDFIDVANSKYKNVYAYTYKKSKTIYPCGLWPPAPTTGADSKMGVFVHELTHAICSIDDYKEGTTTYYGRTLCKQLAETKPDKAINNADCYEYFSETQYLYWDSYEATTTGDLVVLASSGNPVICEYKKALYGFYRKKAVDANPSALYYVKYQGSTWNDFGEIPDQKTTAMPAVIVFNDKIYVVYNSDGQSLSYIYYDGSKWSTVTKLEDVKTKLGAKVAVHNGKLYVFYLDDKTAKYKYFNNNDWSAPQTINDGGGPVESDDVPAAASLKDKLYMFYTDRTNKYLKVAITDNNGVKWKTGALLNNGKDFTAYSLNAVTINEVIYLTFRKDAAAGEIIQIQCIYSKPLNDVSWLGYEGITPNSKLKTSPKADYPVTMAFFDKYMHSIIQEKDKDRFWVMKRR